MDEEKPELFLVAPLYAYETEEVEKAFTVHRLWEAEDPEVLYAAAAPTCRAAVTRNVFGSEMMDKLPNLGLVAVLGVGYDQVDLEAAKARGIAVTNTPDVLSEEVADYAMGLLLSLARRLPQGERYLRAGRWETEGPMAYSRRPRGKKVGVLGLGRIGAAFAKLCGAFDMKVGYHNRNRRDDVSYRYFGSPADLAAWADFLVCITPGGAATRHLVNAEVIEALGPEGSLVNVGRGASVDDDALVAALRSGNLAGAALDVYVDEPNVPKAYLGLEDNLILQPHLASATHETRRAMSQLALDNARAFYEGLELLSPV